MQASLQQRLAPRAFQLLSATQTTRLQHTKHIHHANLQSLGTFSPQRSTKMTTPTTKFYTTPYSPLPNINFTHESYLSWPDTKLEQRHDYIQIIFPLPESSPFNSSAPILSRPDYDAFRRTPHLKSNLRKSLDRMCEFYGLIPDRDEGSGELKGLGRREDLGRTSRCFWLTRFNHNHLRITRIIRSLRVLGLGDEASVFYEKLLEVDGGVGGVVGGRSKMYWKRAIELPLSCPPDEGDEECEWLKEIEEAESR